MTQEANDLLRRALALPPEERAELAGSLLESLDVGEDPGAQAAWHEEIDRRIQDLDSGTAEAIPWAEVQRQIAAKLSNGRYAGSISQHGLPSRRPFSQMSHHGHFS